MSDANTAICITNLAMQKLSRFLPEPYPCLYRSGNEINKKNPNHISSKSSVTPKWNGPCHGSSMSMRKMRNTFKNIASYEYGEKN